MSLRRRKKYLLGRKCWWCIRGEYRKSEEESIGCREG
jgi:hypothetical protein